MLKNLPRRRTMTAGWLSRSTMKQFSGRAAAGLKFSQIGFLLQFRSKFGLLNIYWLGRGTRVDTKFISLWSTSAKHTWYLSFFLHGHYLWLKFLPTIVRKLQKKDFAKNSVNRKKINFFATKYHKLYTQWRRFQISPHLSCGEMWN